MSAVAVVDVSGDVLVSATSSRGAFPLGLRSDRSVDWVFVEQDIPVRSVSPAMKARLRVAVVLESNRECCVIVQSVVDKKKPRQRSRFSLERETGLEPATLSLGS